MSIRAIPKIVLILFSLHLSGCTISGCALLAPHEFTLTFVDSNSYPLAGVTATCSGIEAGRWIADEYNEQHLASNAKGEIVFHRKKVGSNFSYQSVGLFSWNHKSSQTKATCSFSLGNQEIYKSELSASQPSSVIKLER